MIFTIYNYPKDIYLMQDAYVGFNSPEFHPKRKKLKGYQKVRK